jgi:hypothetical protein
LKKKEAGKSVLSEQDVFDMRPGETMHGMGVCLEAGLGQLHCIAIRAFLLHYLNPIKA